MRILSRIAAGAVLLIAASCDGQPSITSPQSDHSEAVSLGGSNPGSATFSVNSVDPGTVSTTVSDDFSDLGFGYQEGVLSRTGVSYAESFAGIPVTAALVWDIALANVPSPPNATSPLSLTAGAQKENLFGVPQLPPLPRRVLAGCGPLTPNPPGLPPENCENEGGNAYGTGAVAALFEGDTDVVVLELLVPVGVDPNGDIHGAWITFFARDGTMLSSMQLGASPGCIGTCAEDAFRAAAVGGSIIGTGYGRVEYAWAAPAGQSFAGFLLENQTGAYELPFLFGIRIESVAWNRLPTAVCQDVTVSVDPGHHYALIPVSTFDGGSSDATGGPVTISLRRATGQTYPVGTEPITFGGIFPIGTTPTVLVATNELGNEDTCMANATVNAPPPPTPVDPHLLCNVPVHRTITPPDAPISFTATGTDGSGAIPVTVTGYECYGFNGSGKRVDKGESCIVGTDGAALTIHDSGGVGDVISWTIEPSAGGTAVSCQVAVVNPNA